MDKGLKNEIIKLRQQGLTYNEIKDELKCSKSTISYHCRNSGLEDSNLFRKPNKEEINQMQKLYGELKSCVKVAEKMNWSRITIAKYVEINTLTEEEVKKQKSDSVMNWRRRTKLKLVEYKGGECKCCGYNKCIEAMEFHHLDPKEKDFTISGKSWSFEKLKKEVDKCVLVCNRCHKEIHFGWIDFDNL